MNALGFAKIFTDWFILKLQVLYVLNLQFKQNKINGLIQKSNKLFSRVKQIRKGYCEPTRSTVFNLYVYLGMILNGKG